MSMINAPSAPRKAKATPADEHAPRLRIGYMPFYVPFYETVHPGFRQEKTEMARQCAELLRGYGEVVWDGKLIDDVNASSDAGTRMAERDVDCVLAVTTIAVFSGVPIAALRKLDKPLLIWNPQLVRDAGPSKSKAGEAYTMVDAVRNTTQIGTQALCNTLLREGIGYRVVTGYYKSKRTGDELSRYFGIMRAVAAVRRARLLDLGGTIPLMDDLPLDENDLARELGATVVHLQHDTLTKAYRAVSSASVRQHVTAMKRNYAVAGMSSDEINRSARLSRAFERLVEEHRADAGTFNCQGGNCRFNPEIGITACYSLGVQNGRGKPFTCTGDLPTALAMLICKRLTGVSLYTEVQLMDEKRRAVVLLNTGEGEPGIARSRCRVSLNGNAIFAGEHGRGASFCFPLEPGPATVVSLTPTPKNKKPYRLIVAEGEVLKDRLPGARSIAGFFRFAGGDLHGAYTRWLQAGPVHHASTTTGHRAAQLMEVADHLNMEYVGVTG